ncbi:response regulator [Psychromarinibacter sp. C21-152]|uniref:Response regulator n=1 Tax=Psychromarinibacter sediminicola TaxID=3033385 RepID=A0AAE3NNK0_9RHOB|nr:response regulator [Psychromarinibacter sediminicola]MDF0599176.1 response regulator [Psychromarinibacter sediminicola]
MPSMLDRPAHHSGASPERPLAGLTVLVIEDSRFASEAVRLLCLKSGARIRRADSLQAARRHLSVYRPSVVIVDLGLPDGSGLDLIRNLAGASPRIPVILATSGDDRLFPAAHDAGADGVLCKPIESLAVFQASVLDILPPEQQPAGLRAVPSEIVVPDPIAFHDDLAHVAEILSGSDDDRTLDYAAHFLAGVARSAHDDALEQAAERLARQRALGRSFGTDLARVAGLLQDRLDKRAAI